jgi:uncharacterized DUF497 family protein
VSTPPIEDFAFDDENESKMWAHGITPRQVLQILDNDPIMLVNRKGRRGRFLLVGRDNGGRCIAVPIERTRARNVWRPVTAWPCKKQEVAVLERG